MTPQCLLEKVGPEGDKLSYKDFIPEAYDVPVPTYHYVNEVCRCLVPRGDDVLSWLEGEVDERDRLVHPDWS